MNKNEPGNHSQVFSLTPIGFLSTCFSEKFGAPRQSGMIPAAEGVLKLSPDPAYRFALNHLETFSHIWLIYIFHHHIDPKHREPWRPRIQPPRIGAPNDVGVFASRSPHRPNPLGLSVVKLMKIDLDAKGGIEIHVSGVDILDGTPVVDIKPYLPFADNAAGANSGWAGSEIKKYPVQFKDEALVQIRTLEKGGPKYRNFRALIEQMLELDPRPTSQRRLLPLDSSDAEGRHFAFRLLGHDVKWSVSEGTIVVDLLTPL